MLKIYTLRIKTYCIQDKDHLLECFIIRLWLVMNNFHFLYLCKKKKNKTCTAFVMGDGWL